MEKRIIVLLMFWVCLMIQGCFSVSTYKLTPEVLEGQKPIDREGVKAVLSHKKNASVFIRPMTELYSQGDNPVFLIGITGEKELAISPEDVQAYVDGTPHHILTHDELLADIKERHDAAVDAAKKANTARSQQIADLSMKSTSDPAVFDPNESTKNSIGNTEKYGYKLDKKGLTEGIADAATQLDVNIEAINTKTKEEVTNLNATYLLRKTTIQPNTWYRGQLRIVKIPDAGNPHEIKMVVTVAGEEHQFVIKTAAVK